MNQCTITSMDQRSRFIRSLLPLVFVLMLSCPCLAGPARSPLLPSQPFLILWAVPNKDCLGRPDPAAFGMEWEGRVAEFYEDSLGLYPYYSEVGQIVNGGLPQHTSLERHLQKVEGDIVVNLPQTGAPGLGVLRWEEWEPQWSRNKGKKRRYLEGSRALLRRFFPAWNAEEVEKWAQVDFEATAQSILIETLREVKRLRPQRLWGVSSYPSCYNFDPVQMRLANYTGRCPAAEMALNDELLWLWKQSDALYPTLKLQKFPEGTKGTWLYTSNQIREALRVAALAGIDFDLPVFPLVKSMYTSSGTFLSEADLVNTVGESAAMGAAGVIIWERFHSTKTQKSCSELATYVREVLGNYAVNVTTASRLCGTMLCQGRGRCIRRKPEEPVYLHLPQAHFLLQPQGADGIRATGKLTHNYLETWRRDFRCQWFETLDGAAADEQSMPTLRPLSNDGPTRGTFGQSARTDSQTERRADERERPETTMMPPGQQPVISGCPSNYVPSLMLSLLLLLNYTNTGLTLGLIENIRLFWP